MEKAESKLKEFLKQDIIEKVYDMLQNPDQKISVSVSKWERQTRLLNAPTPKYQT